MRHALFPAFAPFLETERVTSHIEETDQAYLIELDLPGVKKEDLKISAEQSHLIVEGERKNRGVMRKVFSLPDDVDQEKIEAALADGVLSLALPKKEFAKPKLIAVK